MSLLAWIILGLLAGFIGSKLVNKTGEGVVLDVLLGVVGFLGDPDRSEPWSLSRRSLSLGWSSYCSSIEWHLPLPKLDRKRFWLVA